MTKALLLRLANENGPVAEPTKVAVSARMADDDQASSPDVARKCLRHAKELERLQADMKQTLARRQSRPLTRMDPAIFRSLGLGQFLAPDGDDPAEVEPAAAGVIVPLHPAPKLLQ